MEEEEEVVLVKAESNYSKITLDGWRRFSVSLMNKGSLINLFYSCPWFFCHLFSWLFFSFEIYGWSKIKQAPIHTVKKYTVTVVCPCMSTVQGHSSSRFLERKTWTNNCRYSSGQLQKSLANHPEDESQQKSRDQTDKNDHQDGKSKFASILL